MEEGQLQLFPVTKPSLESSHLNPTDVKGASTTLQSNQRNLLAKFILYKIVEQESINYGRDLSIAYKLADKYPELEFWKGLRVQRKFDSLTIYGAKDFKARLKREFEAFKKTQENHRTIIFEKPSKMFIIGDKVGSDFATAPKKPKTVIDFCK